MQYTTPKGPAQFLSSGFIVLQLVKAGRLNRQITRSRRAESSATDVDLDQVRAFVLAYLIGR